MKVKLRRLVKRSLLILLPLFLIALLVLFLLPQKSLSVNGNSFYSDEQIEEFLFAGKSRKALPFFLQEKLQRHKEIPFVEKYTVSFDGFRNVSAEVYEKTLAGYLRFQDYCLYFDWDGVLVDSSRNVLPGVYRVSGLSITHAVLGEKLAVSDQGSFSVVLSITQFLNRESVEWSAGKIPLSELADGIVFGSSGVSVTLGDITVLLGSADYLETKLALMADMLSQLEGRKGTLYLDSYKEGAAHPSYIFK